MKNKILYSVIALVMAVFMVGCSDNDYTVPTAALISNDNVKTEKGDVTASSATLKGSVTGLSGQSESAYKLYFKYGNAADNLTETVEATTLSDVNNTITYIANVTGMPGQVIYYRACVKLQGIKEYESTKTESVLLTSLKAITQEAASASIGTNSAELFGSVSNPDSLTENAKVGIVVSCNANVDSVRNGVRYEGAKGKDFSVSISGFLPNTTYYYTAYIDLGGGTVYGEVKSFTTKPRTYDAENDFVDLGLSTKWAKFNLGAYEEYEVGGLYAFGDTLGFNTSIDPEKYANADIYKTAMDVAYKAYNGKATLPTVSEFQELFECCTVTWTSVYDANGKAVPGYRFTGPNGNSIFMPAAGSRVEATTTGVGTEGRYLTGSINTEDTRYAQSFLFNQGGNGRSTTPVYQALAVRAVTVAKNTVFKKELINKTWEIDYATDGSHKSFDCPIYFYKSAACWRSVANCEPIINGELDWAPSAVGDISWFLGDLNTLQGYITFNEDGTVFVKHIAADGSETTEEGTYTLDEDTKTIKLNGVTMLMPQVASWTSLEGTEVRILSLTDKTAQFSVTRADGEQISINMVPQIEKYGYTAKLMCYGPTTDGSTEDAWGTAATTVSGTGTYTVTFTTTHPRSAGQVYVLDIEKFAAAYPNAFVRIDAIEADGNEIPFDANKFYYGNIEGGGNFRVEMANIWGCGRNAGWNGLADTPFQKGGGETTNETALAFNSTFTVKFTVVSLDADLSFTAMQSAVGLNSDWSMPGNWGVENPGAIKVAVNNFQYELQTTEDANLSISVPGDCPVGPSNGAVNYVDIVGIRQYFNGFGCELKKVTNDGNDVPFISSKLKYGDIENNGNFRIELHNIWGSGTAADPAFGGATTVAGNNVVTSLGFTYTSVYTIGNYVDSKHLFALPTGWE